jgi:hypothetical protein
MMYLYYSLLLGLSIHDNGVPFLEKTEKGLNQNRPSHHVEVVFRLPTYWCSPNFAFIIAEDIQKYVSELEWVRSVKVNYTKSNQSRSNDRSLS